MGGRLLEGPTMVGRTSDWKRELGRFLRPFLVRLGHKARRQMCPLYVSGLIGPGDRKSIQPMAERLALGEYDQLHHFIAAGVWDAAPVETELLVQADRLVGGSDAVLVIDDTAIPKKGTHSVGVAAQYASALGKTANCRIPDPRGNEVVQLIVFAKCKPLRHRLNALAIARTDQPRHVEWTHLSPRLVTQPTQKRLEKASKLFFPIRRPANHGRPLQKPTTHESQKN